MAFPQVGIGVAAFEEVGAALPDRIGGVRQANGDHHFWSRCSRTVASIDCTHPTMAAASMAPQYPVRSASDRNMDPRGRAVIGSRTTAACTPACV